MVKTGSVKMFFKRFKWLEFLLNSKYSENVKIGKMRVLKAGRKISREIRFPLLRMFDHLNFKPIL